MLQADDESLDSRRHAIYFRSQYMEKFTTTNQSIYLEFFVLILHMNI